MAVKLDRLQAFALHLKEEYGERVRYMQLKRAIAEQFGTSKYTIEGKIELLIEFGFLVPAADTAGMFEVKA